VAHATFFDPPGGVYRFASLANLVACYGVTTLSDEKDAIRTSIILGKHIQEFGMKRVLDYCMGDAKAVIQIFRPLFEDFTRLCGPKAVKNLAQLYQPYALVMAKAQSRGVRFDQFAWE